MDKHANRRPIWKSLHAQVRWTVDLDLAKMHRRLDGESDAEADEPEAVLDVSTAHLPAAPYAG